MRRSTGESRKSFEYMEIVAGILLSYPLRKNTFPTPVDSLICGAAIGIAASYKNIVAEYGSLFLWTYGESNPDLVHAMDAFYR